MIRTSSSRGVLLAVFFATFAWLAAEAAAEVRNPKGVAVIVGNKDYEHRDIPDVSFAHRDADAFRRYAVDVLGYDPENIIDLRDARRRRMFDTLGGRRNPQGELWSYLDPDGGSDVVVFYSGHGVPGMKDKHGYLLPVDGSPNAAEEDGYPIDLLYKNLGSLKEARSVVVYLDACFSGSSAGGNLTRSASPVYVRAALPKELSKKVTALTAASGKQLASWDERARHGLFTHHLLDALYGKGDADKDGKVTAKEAKGYLDRRMTRAARRRHRRIQHASLSGAEGVVLTVAVSGGFPERPSLDGGTKDGKKVEKVAKVVKPPVVEKEVVLDREKKTQVQRGLASLGLYKGFIDGDFGPNTRGAIRSWQKAKGYGETGRLTKEQADALAAVGEEALREKAERRVRQAAERERLAREARAKEEAERKAREEAREREETQRKRAHLRPGEAFRDCKECPEMVVVPAGWFMKGSDKYSSESPPHRVTIPKPFAVGKYEVTFSEWDACVHGGGCGGYQPSDAGWGRGRRPVINVSWRDAKAYVRWLSGKTGKQYRLLSESEWEYVARAGTTTQYSWGDFIGPNLANCWDCSSRWSGHQTVPVGSFPANGFGLHNVHGNVSEWVKDCWNGNYDWMPVDGSAWTGGGCSSRVLRGGSWNNGPRYLRSAARVRDATGVRVSDNGFRVARTLSP